MPADCCGYVHFVFRWLISPTPESESKDIHHYRDGVNNSQRDKFAFYCLQADD
jgi:hypothetical protein